MKHLLVSWVIGCCSPVLAYVPIAHPTLTWQTWSAQGSNINSYRLLPSLQVYSSREALDSIFSFQDAKARLMQENLQLLASYYDINIARAELLQAKVWNNPYFIFNGDLYSNETNEYFHFRNQHLLQLEQTFSYAGKHTNTVKLARVGVEIAEKQMEDVLRSLLFELGTIYNSVAALQEKQAIYNEVINSYERLMEFTRKQLDVGTISVTEALRLESEYLATRTEAIEIVNEKEKLLADMKILLRLPQDTTFWVQQAVPIIAETIDPEILTRQAYDARPDVVLKRLEQKSRARYLQLQKSLSVPDIKLAYQPRDRGSNYVRPYQGFNVEVFVPLFDRNQGNIKAAKFAVDKFNVEIDQLENRVRNEVYASYQRYQNSSRGLANYKIEFLNELERLNRFTNENFAKRNIGLLQFIDQQRIYIQTKLQVVELRQHYLENINELNFTVGTNIIEY